MRFWFSNENVSSSKNISTQNFSTPIKVGAWDNFPTGTIFKENFPSLRGF